jgi:hypothetical protein
MTGAVASTVVDRRKELSHDAARTRTLGRRRHDPRPGAKQPPYVVCGHCAPCGGAHCPVYLQEPIRGEVPPPFPTSPHPKGVCEVGKRLRQVGAKAGRRDNGNGHFVPIAETPPVNPSLHPRAQRAYLLRGRLRCRPCKRRMYGITRPSTRYYSGAPDVNHTYYLCPHDPRNPRHQAQAPDHPATVSFAKTCCWRPSGSSSPPISSDPTVTACWPSSCLPGRLRTPPAGTRRPPGRASGSGRSTPPKTPTSARFKRSPAWTPTHRPRRPCAPGT